MNDIEKLLVFKKFAKNIIILKVGEHSINLNDMTIKKAKSSHYIAETIEKDSELTEEEAIEKAKEYKKQIEQICTIFGISAYEYGYSPLNIAKHFGYLLFNGRELEPLDDFEKKQAQGETNLNGFFSYVNTKEETDENTVSYDVNSFYPYLFLSGTVKCPLKQGKQQKLDEVPKNLFSNAYYLIEAETVPINYTLPKSKTLWVTNFDLLCFNMEKCDYKLKSDCKYNAYVYDEGFEVKSRIMNYIKKVYELKNTNKYAKKSLTLIHGVLFSNKRKYHTFNTKSKNKEEVFEITQTGEFVSSKYNVNEDFDEEDTVKYNFARMKPFFYSYGRYVMYKHIMELKKNNIKIFRVFCDSFTCSKNEYMDKLIGPELGKLKLESKEWNHNCGKFASLKVWKKLE